MLPDLAAIGTSPGSDTTLRKACGLSPPRATLLSYCPAPTRASQRCEPNRLALSATVRRNAYSTAISLKRFIDLLTLASTTPEPSTFTRISTLKSTTRLTDTRVFIVAITVQKQYLLTVELPTVCEYHPASNSRMSVSTQVPTHGEGIHVKKSLRGTYA